MWLGEKISEHGIGNGISLIIAWGIIAGYPSSIITAIRSVQSDSMAPLWIPVLLMMLVGTSALIIFMQQASRKVPVQYARRVVGRRQVQGSSTFLPLKLNTAGVIPVIFASSILMLPSIVISFFSTRMGGAFSSFSGLFDMNSRVNFYEMLSLESGGIFNLLKVFNLYHLTYCSLTVFFCFFYTAITFNPLDTAENLKKMGGFIPGRRPGRNTADYIDYVLTRITIVGALFLVVVAVVPMVVSVAFNLPYRVTDITGGTGLIIVVGVLLDMMKQIESQLLMRHYDGFDYRSGAKRRWEFRPS
jgi:preprotein translocase subunit SecY